MRRAHPGPGTSNEPLHQAAQGYRCPRRSGIGGLSLRLVALTLAATSLIAFADQAYDDEYVVRNEIFGNQQAAELVREARSYDMFEDTGPERNRDKAIEVYEQAIRLQPGAPINAPIAYRIAEHYAVVAVPDKKVAPDYEKATSWYQRAISLTTPTNLLWAKAHAGLGSCHFVRRDRHAAAAAFSRILELDIQEAQLPPWRVWPDPETDAGAAAIVKHTAQLTSDLTEMRHRAVDKVFYVTSCLAGRAAAVIAITDLANQYKGTPIGDRASRLFLAATDSVGPGYELPDSLFNGELIDPAAFVEVQKDETIPIEDGEAKAISPVSTPQGESDTATALASRNTDGPLRWRYVTFACALVALVILVFLALRRLPGSS